VWENWLPCAFYSLAHCIIRTACVGYFSGFGTWGCQSTLGGSFPSFLLSPSLSPSLPFPSLPPFPLKLWGVVRKLGGTNPPEGCVGNSLSVWKTEKKLNLGSK